MHFLKLKLTLSFQHVGLMGTSTLGVIGTLLLKILPISGIFHTELNIPSITATSDILIVQASISFLN